MLLWLLVLLIALTILLLLFLRHEVPFGDVDGDDGSRWDEVVGIGGGGEDSNDVREISGDV